MFIKRNFKYAIKLLVALLLITITILLAFIGWLKPYDQPLTMILPYVNKIISNKTHLQSSLSDINIRLEDKIVKLHISELKLQNKQLLIVAMPDIWIECDFKNLLLKQPVIKLIKLDSAIVNQDDISSKNQQSFKSENFKNYLFKLKTVPVSTIIASNITINSKLENSNIHIKRFDLTKEITLKTINYNVKAFMNYNDQDSALDLSLTLPISTKSNKKAIFYSSLNNFPVNFWLKVLGKSNLLTDEHVVIDRFSTEIKMNQDGSEIAIDNFDINFSNQAVMRFSASLKNFTELEFTSQINQLPIAYMLNIWPRNLAPVTHDWLSRRINRGVIDNGSGKFNINVADLKKHDINASLNISKAEVNYDSDYPLAKDIDGTIKFDNQKIAIEVKQALIGHSKLEQALLTIPYSDDISFKVDKIQGDIADLVKFIPKDIITKMEKSKLYLRQIKGSANSVINNITIPSSEHAKVADFKFDIVTKLQNVSLVNLPFERQLTEAKFDLSLKDENFALKGKGLLNNDESNFDFSARVLADHTQQKLTIESNVSQQFFDSYLILGENPIKAGFVKVKFVMNNQDNRSDIDLTANMNDANIAIAALGLVKNTGEDMMFKAKGDLAKNITFDKILLTGKQLLIEGNIELSEDIISKANFPKINYNNNDFAIKYSYGKQGVFLSIIGDVIDISAFDLKKFNQNNQQQNFKDQLININLNQAIMKNNIKLDKISASFACNKLTGCNAGYFDGKIFDSNYLKMKFKPRSQYINEVTIDTDDIGGLLKAVDSYKDLVGGNLVINAIRSVENQQSTIEGKLIIKKFTTIKTPILNKIFTLPSLKGIMHVVGKNEIDFDLMEVDFNNNSGKTTLTEGKLESSTLGATCAGLIDSKNSHLDLSGVLVPNIGVFINVNTLLNKVPVINQLFGGKKEGIVASKYRVHGKFGHLNTDISGLSVLTPGIFRSILDVFEKNNATN